jgi:group II intron reverse transcriptase/maturase
MRNRQAEEHVQAVLAGIANRARVSKRHRFGGVYTLLDEEFLRWSFYNLNRKAAPGVDEVTWQEYESNLDENLSNLVGRLKRKAYKARLVKRHYIPKGKKLRPLGLPVLEDKLVQHAAKTILEAIYEADFYEYSFAYRPERSAKDATSELCFRLQFGPFGWVVECDIRSFFDEIDHDWMVRMLEERIHDKAFVGLIRKWLKAGVLEDIHTVTHPASGTPQGGVASPVLANIYLHYALDLWFQKVVQKEARGECLMMRYADDVVCAFRYKDDAERFLRQAQERLAKFMLSFSLEKTHLIRFTRFETKNSRSFEFLGFEFRWGLNRHYKPQVKRRTLRKKLQAACREMTAWIRKERCKQGLRGLMATFRRKLQGHWNYFGVHLNSNSLWEFYRSACQIVFKWLNRRSQRRSFTWERFERMLDRYQIPKPRITQKVPRKRYACV